jgi:excinuclease ABC subunit B
MAKTPDSKSPDKTKSQKDPAKPTRAKAHRPDVQPIGPALAELLNPALNSGDAGIGSGTGLQQPPDNSKDRRAGGEAAVHRARASTKANDTLPREPSIDRNFTRNTIQRRDNPLRPNPQPPGSRASNDSSLAPPPAREARGGEGSGGGGATRTQHLRLTPLPNPPPQGGREQ